LTEARGEIKKMLSIRLTRMGRKSRPFYRIVLTDSRKPREGKFLETFGHYNPITKGGDFEIDQERVEKWIAKGAQPSDTVRSLLKKAKNRNKTASEISKEKHEEEK
jgi:small subunit ribosomal protein S16